jgi:hypothetical protein
MNIAHFSPIQIRKKKAKAGKRLQKKCKDVTRNEKCSAARERSVDASFDIRKVDALHRPP